MATSNNDRISSRRLLDTLKGLQASRHLGSEPEVVTETETVTTEVKTQYPPEDQYTKSEMAEVLQSQLPSVADVVSTRSWDLGDEGDSFVIGDYSESNSINRVDKSGSLLLNEETVNALVESDYTTTETYTGYGVALIDGKCYGVLADNGVIVKVNDSNAFNMYVYLAIEEMETEITTTTKTKHTVKQDYLPNADWTVNDPDADGYVQGRTHWVEFGETEAIVSVQSGAQMGNFAVGTCNKFGAVKRFEYPNGEYDPGRTGEIVAVDGSGEMQFSYIGEDTNGNAITPTSLNELTSALETTAIGIMLLKQGATVMVYIAYPNVIANDVCTAIIVSENVHKLDRKFYEYINEEALKKSLQVQYPSGWYLGAGDIELSSYFNNYSQGMYSSNGLYVTYLYSGDVIVALKASMTQYSPKTAIYYFGSKVAVPVQKIYRKLHSVTVRANTLGSAVNYNCDFIPFVFYMTKTNFQCCKFDVVEMYNESDKVCTRYKGDSASTILNNICISYGGFRNFNTSESVEVVLIPHLWKNYYFINWNKDSQYSPAEYMSKPFIIASNENRFVVDETSQKIYWRVEWDSVDNDNRTIAVNNSYKTVPRGSGLFKLQPPSDFVNKEAECYAIDNNGNKHVATIKIGYSSDQIKSDDTFTCVKIYANTATDIYKPVWQYIDELNSKSYRDHEYVSLDELL